MLKPSNYLCTRRTTTWYKYAGLALSITLVRGYIYMDFKRTIPLKRRDKNVHFSIKVTWLILFSFKVFQSFGNELNAVLTVMMAKRGYCWEMVINFMVEASFARSRTFPLTGKTHSNRCIASLLTSA